MDDHPDLSTSQLDQTGPSKSFEDDEQSESDREGEVDTYRCYAIVLRWSLFEAVGKLKAKNTASDIATADFK